MRPQTPALDRVDIGVSADSAPDPATVDEQVSWVITISNTSPLISVAEVELDADLAGIPFTLTDLGGCSANDQNLSCLAGPLELESSTTVTVTGQATQAGDVVLAATATIKQITGFEPIDANPGNNFSIATKNIGESFSSGPGQTLASASGLALAAGDVYHDGYTDLVVATGSGISTKVYLSSPRMGSEPGAEMFRQLWPDPVALGDVETASTSISVVDLDGDGLMDLIYANGSPNEIVLNVGGGSFVPGPVLGDSDSRAVSVDDFDGDGVLDRLFAHIDGPSRAYRGLEAGSFADGVAIEVGPVVSVQSNDVSGDSRPDLIFGRETATPPTLPSNAIYVNTSTAEALSFSPIGTALGTSPTIKVLSDDVSMDGTIDLVTLNKTGTHQVFVGSGNGAFNLHSEQFLSEGTTSVAFGDFNNDGRIDLAVGGLDNIDIFLNDGFGNLGAGGTALPVINMLGPGAVSLQVGDAYEDASSTAFDIADGDLTDMIETTNPVKTAVVGSYFVTYNVFDLSGNAALSVSRSVTVPPIENVGGGGGGATTAWLLAVLSFLSLLRRRVLRK